MKIVQVDNYNRDTVSDRLVAENISNQREAELMCKALNDDARRSDSEWFRVVDDEYKLWKGMEEIV